jgi:Phage P22-like portal protein
MAISWPWSRNKEVISFDTVRESPEELQKIEEKDFIDAAIKRVESRRTMDGENRAEAVDSLKFLEGLNHWDDGEKARRKTSGRPYLQMNKLPTYTHEVIYDGNMNKFRIKVLPNDMDGDLETAKIKAGIISQAEYSSSADQIYLMVRTGVVECGFGAYRILTRYCDDNPFLQEMYLEPIFNPFNVFMDVNANPWLVYADANWCGITAKIDRDVFEELYPDAETPTEKLAMATGTQMEHWWSKNDVTVLEYYWRVIEKAEMCLLSDNTILSREDAEKKIKLYEQGKRANNANKQVLIEKLKLVQPMTPEAQQLQQQIQQIKTIEIPEIKDSREASHIGVRYAKLSAAGIIEGGKEGTHVPGKYIPVVLATGRKRNIDGKIYISGLIKHAKDPTRLENYFVTSMAETVALAPKVPWIGTPAQFKNFQRDYARANQENFPFVQYNPQVIGGQVLPPPSRVQPATVPQGAAAMVQVAEQGIHDTIGMGKRDVGEAGPERNASAIVEARRPSDTATSDFSEWTKDAVAHGGRIMEAMIAEVYDTSRDVRIRDEQGNEKFVPVNTPLPKVREKLLKNPTAYQPDLTKQKVNQMAQTKGPNIIVNDLTKGRGKVVIDAGPSMSTQRQETAHKLMIMGQGNSRMHNLVDDIILKAMGDPYMDEAARRLRKALKMSMPGIVEDTEEDQQNPTPPAPIPPKVQADMGKVKVMAMKAQTEQTKQAIEKFRAETERMKLLKEMKDTSKETRQMLIEMIKELTAEHHWSDDAMGEPGQQGQQQGQRQGQLPQPGIAPGDGGMGGPDVPPGG